MASAPARGPLQVQRLEQVPQRGDPIGLIRHPPPSHDDSARPVRCRRQVGRPIALAPSCAHGLIFHGDHPPAADDAHPSAHPGRQTRVEAARVHPPGHPPDRGLATAEPARPPSPEPQGLGKVGGDGLMSGVFGVLAGVRRIPAGTMGGANHPCRRGCRAAMSSSATTALSRRPLRQVLEGVADSRDRRGVRPRPGLDRVPGRGRGSGGVPHSGGDARARRRLGPRRSGALGTGFLVAPPSSRGPCATAASSAGATSTRTGRRQRGRRPGTGDPGRASTATAATPGGLAHQRPRIQVTCLSPAPGDSSTRASRPRPEPWAPPCAGAAAQAPGKPPCKRGARSGATARDRVTI